MLLKIISLSLFVLLPATGRTDVVPYSLNQIFTSSDVVILANVSNVTKKKSKLLIRLKSLQVIKGNISEEIEAELNFAQSKETVKVAAGDTGYFFLKSKNAFEIFKFVKLKVEDRSFADQSITCESKKVCVSNEFYQYIESKKAPQKKLSDKELTILGFVIGKSTLAEVAKIMPNKNLVQSGDAGKSNSSLCYIDGVGTTFTFNSSPMGGSEKILTDVTLQKNLKKSQDKAICSQSDKINSNINIYDLKLGLGKKEVLTLKGKPNKELKDKILYIYESSINIGESRYNISSILELHFSNDKLIRIDLSKIESN